MRLTICLSFVVLVLTCLSSCSKGDLVDEPLFGVLSIRSVVKENITVVKGNGEQFVADGGSYSIPAGKNRLRFYNGQAVLLDTLLTVDAFKTNRYIAFQPAANAALKIYDSRLNGIDQEQLPDSGYVKFSLANYSKTLPNKVDIYLTTTTYTPNSDKPIQVGEFLNVSPSFSAFQKVTLGATINMKVVNKFTMIVKDPVSQVVLATVPFELPLVTAGEKIGQLINSIFIIYLNDANTASILMSK